MRTSRPFGRSFGCVLLVAAAASAGCTGRHLRSQGDEPEAPAPTPPPPPAAAPKPVVDVPRQAKSAQELVEDMHVLYSGVWYRSKTVSQHNTLYTASGKELKSEWMQRISVPGKLRIDFLPEADHSGMLVTDDSITTFAGGKRTGSQRAINPLLLLTVDLYAVSPAAALRRLTTLGVSLKAAHVDQWEGRPVYVIGAKAGDTTSAQFWVDTERMVVVRWIHREGRGKQSVVVDVRIGQYKERNGVPIPFEVLTLHNGKAYFREEYDTVELDVGLPDQLFEAKHWVTASAQ